MAEVEKKLSRTGRAGDLTTPTARRRIIRGSRPQWKRIAKGRAVGYRRGIEGAGTWYVRAFVGKGDEITGGYRFGVLGPADDEGARVDGALSWADAVERASGWNPDAAAEAPQQAPMVADAVRRYLAWYKVHRRAYESTRATFEAHVLPELGGVELARLTTDRLRAWHEALAAAPARLRSRAGRAPNVRHAATEEQQRSRRNTANRILGTLKAALTRAWEDGIAPSRDSWHRVKPFRGADSSRIGYLDAEQLRRLLNSCSPDFRELVRAAIYTGARFGELARARVADFRPEASALFIARSKAGDGRHVYLGAEGLAFFEGRAAGRPPLALLLPKANGAAWGKSEQARPMAEACDGAQLDRLGFHQLRHTYASLYLMAGGSLVALAAQLGHSTTRMVERHYGHLSNAWRAEEAVKHAPSLGADPPTVAAMRKRAGRRS